jgi:hypothetical protein
LRIWSLLFVGKPRAVFVLHTRSMQSSHVRTNANYVRMMTQAVLFRQWVFGSTREQETLEPKPVTKGNPVGYFPLLVSHGLSGPSLKKRSPDLRQPLAAVGCECPRLWSVNVMARIIGGKELSVNGTPQMVLSRPSHFAQDAQN